MNAMLIRLAHIVSIILLVSLQISWAAWLGVYTPELVLSVVLAFGLTGDQLNSWWWIGLGGLLLDTFGGVPFGFHWLAFGLLNLGLVVLTGRVFHRPTPMIALVIFYVTALIFSLALNLLSGQLAWSMLTSASLTAIVAVGFYRSIALLGRRREVIQLG